MLQTQALQYAMLSTALDVCLAMSLAREYNSDLEVDHWRSGQNCPQWNKDMFLDYGKRFVVKGYADASLTLIQMTLSLDLDTY